MRAVSPNNNIIITHYIILYVYTYAQLLHRDIFCSLLRKVKDESATGSSTSNRVRTTLTISVEDIEYDTSACQLRVKGRNIQENQYVKVSTKTSCTHAHTHTHSLTHTYSLTHILTHTHTCTYYTHTHTFIHTHTRTHTQEVEACGGNFESFYFFLCLIF
jgi:hypothetical protein